MKHGLILAAMATTIALTGCGGGGTPTASGGTGRATILITDSFREDFSQVWATIYKVELVSDGGSTVTVFEDATGKQIDLKTLRDSTGARYAFLSSASVPAGTYMGVKVTVGPTMSLIKSGSTTATSLTVDTTLPKDASGNPIISTTFKAPKTLGSTATNIPIDFDLARFVLRGSNVLPALAEGTGEGIDDHNRHESDDYHGAVSALSGTAPTLSFTLTQRDGTTVTVVTTAATAVYGATLTNGVGVEVEGTLDTTTQNLVATKVEVRGTPSAALEDRPKAAGAASAISGSSFTVTIREAEGFTPSGTTVTVVLDAGADLRGDAGTKYATPAAFLTALAATPSVAVSGTYDATTNTLTATRARIHDKSKDGGWERESHGFRDGGNGSNWGNDAEGHDASDKGNGGKGKGSDG